MILLTYTWRKGQTCNWQVSWPAPLGEALLLALLIALRFVLVDDPQAAADEVFAWHLRCVHRITWSPNISRKALMHSKRYTDVRRESEGAILALMFKASSICERNENNRVTRVVNLSYFGHSHGRVASKEKLSHNTRLGFPLVWLVRS